MFQRPAKQRLEHRLSEDTKRLERRLLEEAKRLREQAELLRHGTVRDATLRQARQAETGSHISEWRSPGLLPPN